MLTWDKIKVQTLGQAVYLAVMSNPDGLASEELATRIQELQESLELDAVVCSAEALRMKGYLRRDQGRWYAPGPTHAVWEML